jgi:hypothetical protein
LHDFPAVVLGFDRGHERRVNLEALRQINPDYALTFRKEPLGNFLARITSGGEPMTQTAGGLSLDLDTSALTGFFDALADGEIDADEAATLAALPSNQAMLEHRRNLGYVPEPLPDTESLAEMIGLAGSTDPLNRLWCWINPQNAFGYADLAQNVEDYSRFLSELEHHEAQLVASVLSQIGGYSPAGLRFEARFAFTLGWAIRGWATAPFVGLDGGSHP